MPGIFRRLPKLCRRIRRTRPKLEKTMVKAKAKSKTENVADLSAKLGQMMNESAQQDSSDPAPAPEKKSASRSNFKGELLIPAPQGGVLSVIPIKTYVAVDEDKVERHMYHSADCRNSLNYGAMTCSGCGTVVDKNSAVKGVEVDGKIILVSDDDLKSQQPMRDGKMKILEYVNETDINPIYYEDAEFVVPDRQSSERRARKRRACAQHAPPPH
jgi:non-homologous end joining protein Ku